jgi:microsomal dipeptidase-like Zn-dependent dipeptidase
VDSLDDVHDGLQHARENACAANSSQSICPFGSVIEEDVKMVQILHQLGVRIMQLSYNNQSGWRRVVMKSKTAVSPGLVSRLLVR